MEATKSEACSPYTQLATNLAAQSGVELPQRRGSGHYTHLTWQDHSVRRTMEWTPFGNHQNAWRWSQPAHLSRTELPDRTGSITAGSTCRVVAPWRSVDPPLEAAIKAGRAVKSTLLQLHPAPGALIFVLDLFETRDDKWVAAVELDEAMKHHYGLLPVRCVDSPRLAWCVGG